MKTRHSYVRFFPSDWKAGTGRMPRMHRSVYHDICCEIWDFNRPLTPGALRLLLSDLPEWQVYVDDLVEGGKLSRLPDGSITNDRAAAEATWAFDQWEKRSFGGKGGRAAPAQSDDDQGVQEDSSKSHEDLLASDNQNQNHKTTLDAIASNGAASSNPPVDGENSPTGDAPSPAPIDIAKSIFDGGVNMLRRQGYAEKRAREIVGKWRGTAQSDGIVLSCLSRAQSQAAPPSDLVAWMFAAITAEKGRLNDAPAPRGADAGPGPTERAAMAAFGVDPPLGRPADAAAAGASAARDPDRRAIPDAGDE